MFTPSNWIVRGHDNTLDQKTFIQDSTGFNNQLEQF